MSGFRALLGQRFKEGDEKKLSKMNELVQRSHQGQLSGFSGVFQIPETSPEERSELEKMLLTYAHEKQETGEDLSELLTITAEVKAINNQAILLHGERIKKAQILLKNYKEGAFTKWLLSTYGNRQTPYNFLQYFELYSTLTDPLKKVADAMPKQVLYSLSSRSVPQEKKEAFILEYSGENKQILLRKLRDTFPLKKEDKRQKEHTEQLLLELEKMVSALIEEKETLSKTDKKKLYSLVAQLEELL